MLAILLRAVNSGIGGKMIYDNSTVRIFAFCISFEISILKMVLASPSRAGGNKHGSK
ncbi:Uncharacterised protein [uncultured archaeon]|nr:Uncharacterised protein [uncultured archaeon]